MCRGRLSIKQACETGMFTNQTALKSASQMTRSEHNHIYRTSQMNRLKKRISEQCTYPRVRLEGGACVMTEVGEGMVGCRGS